MYHKLPRPPLPRLRLRLSPLELYYEGIWITHDNLMTRGRSSIDVKSAKGHRQLTKTWSLRIRSHFNLGYVNEFGNDEMAALSYCTPATSCQWMLDVRASWVSATLAHDSVGIGRPYQLRAHGYKQCLLVDCVNFASPHNAPNRRHPPLPRSRRRSCRRA